MEKFLRLMVWRFSEDEEWKTYGYEVMAFGDKLAATALECAKRKVSEIGEDIDPVASKRIRTDLYVDDGASGGTKQEVERFVGKKDKKGKYDGTLQKIFEKGGFSIKCFVWSGCKDE